MTGCDELFNVCAFEFMRGFTNADSISSMTSMVHDLAVPFQGFESGPSFFEFGSGVETEQVDIILHPVAGQAGISRRHFSINFNWETKALLTSN